MKRGMLSPGRGLINGPGGGFSRIVRFSGEIPSSGRTGRTILVLGKDSSSASADRV